MGWRRRVFLFFVFLCLVSFSSFSQSELISTVYRITLDNQIIQPVVADYLQQAIEKAEKEKAKALLIILDTPGGLLESTHRIVKAILNSKVKIIVYVSPPGARAASAGTFITLAADVAAMAPSTHIGAAHPVQLGGVPGEEGPGPLEKIKELAKKKSEEKEVENKDQTHERTNAQSPMEDKILNDTLAWIEGIAKERGRNVDWAKNAVTESVSVDAAEALKLNVINLVAADETELLQKTGFGSATVIDIPMTWSQKVLTVLIHPNIAYILMMLGFYGLLFEITHPGSIFPGVAGLISLILAFYAMHVLPTNFAGIGLIMFAVILFIAEVYTPTYGVLGLGALISLILGSLFLIDSPAEFLNVSLTVIVPMILFATLLGIFLVTLVWRSRNRKGVTGSEGLVGEEAIVDERIAPTGKVFIHGELWNARADRTIEKGEKVTVAAVHGMELEVKRN